MGCRPALNGDHNRLVPLRRLRRKTRLSQVTSDRRWQQDKRGKLLEAIRSSSKRWLIESLESEHETLLQISNHAASHCTLATAHAAVQRMNADTLQFPFCQELLPVGLVSYSIAVAGHGLDEDKLRKAYREARGVQKTDVVKAECFWVNTLGNL